MDLQVNVVKFVCEFGLLFCDYKSHQENGRHTGQTKLIILKGKIPYSLRNFLLHKITLFQTDSEDQHSKSFKVQVHLEPFQARLSLLSLFVWSVQCPEFLSVHTESSLDSVHHTPLSNSTPFRKTLLTFYRLFSSQQLWLTCCQRLVVRVALFQRTMKDGLF